MLNSIQRTENHQQNYRPNFGMKFEYPGSPIMVKDAKELLASEIKSLSHQGKSDLLNAINGAEQSPSRVEINFDYFSGNGLSFREMTPQKCSDEQLSYYYIDLEGWPFKEQLDGLISFFNKLHRPPASPEPETEVALAKAFDINA